MPGVRLIPPQGIQRTNLISSDTRHNHFIPTQGYTSAAAVISLLNMEFEDSDWFDTAFLQRIPLTINAGQVPSTQTDFPLLINDTYPNLIGEVEAEIRFAGSDKIQLEYEIQKFDNSTGLLIAFTKKPTVSDGDFLGIYFDNPGASDEQNPAAVWSDYGAVYHMNQTIFGVDSILDSTVNDNKGSTVGAPFSVAGQIGDAYRTNSGGIVTIPTSPSVDIGGGSFTIEAWIETFAAADNFFGIIEKKLAFNGLNKGFQIHNDFRNPIAGLQVRLNNGVTSTNDRVFNNYDNSTAILQNNGLHHITSVFDSTSRVVQSYVDSNPGNTNSYLDTPIDFTNALSLKFGDTNTPDMTFDEVRLSSVAKTADYVTTSFNNQSSPTTFYTTGPVESVFPDLGIMELETLGNMELESL